VIPLGSAVELRLADGTIIEATAQDTGGAIDGAEIDVLMADVESALEFGRQAVEVRVIK
jgi:3D (Asp-Asp-Asp) domain-containing protein